MAGAPAGYLATVIGVSVNPGSNALCHPLREDPELAEVIPPVRRQQAIEECSAPELRLAAGGGGSRPVPGLDDGGIGMLVLSGLLIRHVGIDGRFGAELLGDGDLLRPWQGEHESPLLPVQTGWSVIRPARLAVLDSGFVGHVSAYPELAGCFVARATQRARNLAVNMAIVHQARVDVRLRMLLWHLAGRWGRVRSDGTVVPLRLTHAVLAELVAARRPTVTSALSDLSRRELIRPFRDGWLLYGEPPGDLLDIESPAESAPRTAAPTH
jgi:CRP/FNR family transcriptional regulator, cyclic AMP receptor protein